jgi:hypothetical protein|tara:strand:- start:2859 stop:3152 length:294 start_codon:yes stop_codon:yes gene_type:complete
MRIGFKTRGYKVKPVTRKGRMGLNTRETMTEERPGRPKKLQGRSMYDKVYDIENALSFSTGGSVKNPRNKMYNMGGYISIQEMEKKCGTKTSKNRMK